MVIVLGVMLGIMAAFGVFSFEHDPAFRTTDDEAAHVGKKTFKMLADIFFAACAGISIGWLVIITAWSGHSPRDFATQFDGSSQYEHVYYGGGKYVFSDRRLSSISEADDEQDLVLYPSSVEFNDLPFNGDRISIDSYSGYNELFYQDEKFYEVSMPDEDEIAYLKDA